MKINLRWLAAIPVFMFFLALTADAADHAVQMTDTFSFSPSYLEIEAGDTVTWYNNDDTFSHNARSTTGAWDTGTVDFGESATLQFNTAGTYPYRDSVFYPSGMTGTLVVKAAVIPLPPALLISPALLPGGAFRFTITNLTAGKTNLIEGSTNLLQWLPRSTNVPAGNVMHFTNATGLRFFRSRQLP